MKKKVLGFILAFTFIAGISLFVIASEIFSPDPVVEKNIVSRTAFTDTSIENAKFKTEVHPRPINYLDSNGTYVPYDLTLQTSNRSNFNYELNTVGLPFKIFIRENSNTAEAVRFEKDGYFFTYDLGAGTMQWVEQPGKPSAWATLGSGVASNSKDSIVAINKNNFVYTNAFSNTDVSYSVFSDMLKETFILKSLPRIKDYTYLE